MIAKEGAGRAGFGKDPTEVGVAGTVADVEENGMGKGSGAVRDGGDFGSKNWVEAGFPCGEEKFDRSVEVGIRQPDGGEAQLRRPGEDGADRQERVMKAVVGPDIERGVGKHEVLYKCIITEFREAQA